MSLYRWNSFCLFYLLRLIFFIVVFLWLLPIMGSLLINYFFISYIFTQNKDKLARISHYRRLYQQIVAIEFIIILILQIFCPNPYILIATLMPLKDHLTSESIIPFAIGLSVPILSYISYNIYNKITQHREQQKKIKKYPLISDIIGHTPLIYLPKLSAALKCQIYAKMEYLNPFGSGKDRAVKWMLEKAIQKYKEEGKVLTEVVEASSGSTAISLIQICKLYNLKSTIFLPDDLSEDKYIYLTTLGASIIKLPQVSIVDPNHFYNKARDYAKQNNAYFLNQFDNLDNMQTHFKTTGPEIYSQMKCNVHAFVCSAGTGGTLAGVGKYLKQVTNGRVKVVLADPEGSGLHAKVKYGALFTIQERQGYRLKNPFDTIIEGVGLTRPTKNFENAEIDDSYKITDIEALHMSYYLLQNQGLFVGGSCALNMCAVVKYCLNNRGSRVVTILHDSGNRYLKKFYNEKYLKQKRIDFKRRQKYDPESLDFIQ